ncbi:hypothetical protein [Moritella sp. Urea-trap-13]|uniref:hypothetical protein n=1 Tax=Moritella sp. Urea-trap-13 TaxID=2058327 RepID=UPI000C33ABC9|nr:hypothetical protein [Moritella sp. Urea-trap-13]PKH08182.1 hypothetical protein CXF93_05770 [Moritella sp. Urea-trap-13]
MIVGPFFSEKDSELLRQGSVRDYLGLLPVWSKIARKLEPNLSGAIRSYKGLEAVLFIYYLEKEHGTESGTENNSFRIFFQYMEALIEYYLYYYLKIDPCYGSRLLKGNSTDVDIKLSSATAVNGLYQFYRGTCRRAGMLSDSWVLDETVVVTIEPICTVHGPGVNNLIQLIEKKILAKDISIKPFEVFSDEKIVALFKALFSSEELKTYIRNALYADNDLKYYASACASVRSFRKKRGGDSELNLAQHLETYIAADNKQWPYFSELKHIKYAEPFLSLLDDSFQLLHLHDGRKLSELESILIETSVIQVAQVKAVDFKRIISSNGDYETSRFKLLFGMASLLAKKDVKSFLLALLEYHRSIMSARGAGAMILLEEGRLRVTSEIHNLEQTRLLDSIRDKSPWKNGYYINISAGIYNQLNGVK